MSVATLEEVREFVSKEAEKRNGKVIRKLPKMMRELTTKTHFYVFNVGPWEWQRQMGGKGTKTLQKCEEGEPYSNALGFPVLDNETIAVDMNKMENLQEEGEVTLQAFLMEGYGFKPEMSLRNWGVEVSEKWPPSKELIAKANQRLNVKFDELIAEADRFHESREHQNITDQHRYAARRRKQSKGWLNQNPDMESCPACGETVKSNIARCPHCTAVLNEELDRKYFPEKYKKAS